MLLPKRRWMHWLQKSWQNKALWKNTQDPLPTARQGIFLLNHVEEFDILKSRSLWMERNIMFVKIKADIRHWLRELDKKYFCVMLGFAVMVYFPLISLKLTNTVDGLWTTAEYMAGAWELSNGRWFWLVTSFLRFSLQLEPINAVVCLVLVSLGVTRLHMLFKPAWMRTSCIDWLAGLCYVSNVVVGCYLSFHFIAPEYGFSFFFAMLATEHVIRGKSAVSSIVPAAVLLALSLGLYQTNLACFCLVLLAYFLLLLFQNGEKQKIREYICKSLASAASGAVLYLLILKITLWATGTAMADYQGGADISVSGILKNLPSSVEKCYELFYRYFFGTLVKHNMLQETAVVFALIFCVVGAALACRLVRLIRRKDWENTFYGTAALLVLPMMCTVFMVATSQASFYIPMSGGLALFLPVCFWLLDSSREGKTACDAFRKCWNKAEKALILLTAAAVVYGSVFMSAVDQQAMYEGRKATKQIADLVAGELVAEGYYDLPEKLPVMLVGRPSASPLFRTEEIKRMPTFPEKGSMQEMDGVYVIKISEDYLIDE